MLDFSQYSTKELINLKQQIDHVLNKRKRDKFYCKVEKKINDNGYYVGLPDDTLNETYNYRSVGVPIIIGANCRSMDSRDIDTEMYFSDISDECTIPAEFIGDLDKIKTKHIVRTGEWSCDKDPYRAEGQVRFNIYYKPKIGPCYDLDNNREVYIYNHDDKFYLYIKSDSCCNNPVEIDEEFNVSNFEIGKDLNVFGYFYKFSFEIKNYKLYIPKTL